VAKSLNATLISQDFVTVASGHWRFRIALLSASIALHTSSLLRLL
jgi:hypothetical protein